MASLPGFPTAEVDDAPNLFFRVLFSFEYGGDVETRVAGWTETYFGKFTGHQNAMDNARALLALRMPVSSQPVLARFIRVSDEFYNGDALDDFQNMPQAGAYTTSGNDTPWQAVLIKWWDSTFRAKRFSYIRGIPDFVYDRKNVIGINPTPEQTTWYNRLIAFRNALALNGGPWRIRHKDRPGEANKVFILTIAQVGSTITITTAAPHGVTAGSLFQIYNIRQAPKLRGFHRAATVADATTLTFTTDVVFTPPYKGGAYLGPVVYGFVPIFNDTWEFTTHRDVGRPSSLQRGRRR